MHPRIQQNYAKIRDLCRRFDVTRLDLFGSAAGSGYAQEPHDFDFLVHFHLSGEHKALDAYFGLKESLEELLGRPVDLVMPSALENPYFRAQVERQQQPLYET
jgi:predicted nucleotidyltransferase